MQVIEEDQFGLDLSYFGFNEITTGIYIPAKLWTFIGNSTF